MTAPIAVWDWTLPAGERIPSELVPKLKQVFKKWSFQKEEGDTGYVHYQGRGSLFKKRRLQELKKLCDQLDWRDIHLSPSSSNSCMGDAMYTMKIDTRIDGPWTDKDEDAPVYIPRQYRGLDQCLYYWQQDVWDSADQFDSRTINLVYDPAGNNGKSVISALMDLHKRGITLPPINDAEKLIQSVADVFISREIREPKCVFVDLPRAMDKRKLGGLYSAIEQIKNGKVYDTRYQYKEWWFDSPQIWVFSNISPDLSLLSRDRWKCWTIVERRLQPFDVSPT
jgi:hypothetical protein